MLHNFWEINVLKSVNKRNKLYFDQKWVKVGEILLNWTFLKIWEIALCIK